MDNIIDVLIIDDQPHWQQRLQELVGSDFIVDVVACPTGEESCLETALATINRRFYYCAIVDLSLIPDNGKDEGGMRVLETLAGLNEGTQMLMLTAYATVPSAKKALEEWKVSKYIEKRTFEDTEVILKTREMIQQMVFQARGEYKKRYGSGIKLLTGNLVEKEAGLVWETSVMNALDEPGKGGYPEFSRFLDELLFELAPLIVQAPGDTPKLDKKSLLVEANYWSKGMGEPVVICFGREMDINKKKEALQITDDTIIRQVKRGIYTGLVLKSNLAFEEFSL